VVQFLPCIESYDFTLNIHSLAVERFIHLKQPVLCLLYCNVCDVIVNNCIVSKFAVSRSSRPATSEVGRTDTRHNLSRYRQRHLNERRQPITDLEDVEPDSDNDIIPPSPVNQR